MFRMEKQMVILMRKWSKTLGTLSSFPLNLRQTIVLWALCYSFPRSLYQNGSLESIFNFHCLVVADST